MNKILGRKPTFGDEAQIKEIHLQQLKDKVSKDDEFKSKSDEYYKIERKIERLGNERDNIYSELEKIAIEKGIHPKDVWRII